MNTQQLNYIKISDDVIQKTIDVQVNKCTSILKSIDENYIISKSPTHLPIIACTLFFTFLSVVNQKIENWLNFLCDKVGLNLNPGKTVIGLIQYKI